MQRTSDDIAHMEAHFDLVTDPAPHVVAAVTTHFKDGETDVRSGVVTGHPSAEIAMAILGTIIVLDSEPVAP